MASAQSLLFIPDISGYTQFVQTTEAEHSQHVIAELLEVLLEANTQDLVLAEVEGDALFLYKEGEVPSQEKLLAQIETMFTAFYSHLKMLETNRICPCNACATAPNLRLKIVAHCADLKFLEVKGNRKPFGPQVIEAHRLLKNSIESDNYALISRDLARHIGLPPDYSSKVFHFQNGCDTYDGKEVAYSFSLIDQQDLNLLDFNKLPKVEFDVPPKLRLEKIFNIPASTLYEYISNLRYRHHWVNGVDSFEYDENEVSRTGTEHLCVINRKHLNITALTKNVPEGHLNYGEMTKSLLPFDVFYQFYTIEPVSENKSKLIAETYWESKSPLKRLFITLLVKRAIAKSGKKSIEDLYAFIDAQQS